MPYLKWRYQKRDLRKVKPRSAGGGQPSERGFGGLEEGQGGSRWESSPSPSNV